LKLLHCVAAAVALAACASAPPSAAPLASRDDRSRQYCHLLAVNSAQESTANRLCRDLEDAAAMRARSFGIGAGLDRECAKLATFDGPGQPFSWVVYVSCVDDSI
jgi:hypothetical protein